MNWMSITSTTLARRPREMSLSIVATIPLSHIFLARLLIAAMSNFIIQVAYWSL